MITEAAKDDLLTRMEVSYQVYGKMMSLCTAMIKNMKCIRGKTVITTKVSLKMNYLTEKV